MNRIIYPIFSLAFTAVLCMACGCNNQTDTVASAENAPKLSDIEVTVQGVLPGVESNLRQINNYNVEFKGDFPEETEMMFLLVDSVKLKVKYLEVEGERAVLEDYSMKGNFSKIQFKASQLVFSNPNEPDAQLHILSGKQLKGKAQLEVNVLGKTEFVDLGEVKVLERIIGE